MVDVFVSYSSEDRETVRPIVSELEEYGWSVWWDRQIDAGSTFDRAIEKAIDEASCVVVVWSKKSVDSEWVRTEANEGLERSCLIPISIEKVKPPLAFRRIQHIDMQEAQAQQNLIDAISKFADAPLSDSGDATPFIGRNREFGQTVDHLEDTIEGQGGFVLLSGEAGVGKTRITLEAAKLARKKGILVLSGHCMGMDGAPPYQPLLEQIENAIRLTSAENLRLALGENAPEVAKLMPELHQIYNDIEQPVSLPPEQERRYLLHGVGEFVARASATQPMLLIFEDLHFADDSTCILLRHLANRLKESRVLMLGTYRDTELDSNAPFKQALQELNRERLVDDIALKRFDRDGVKEMLEGRARKTAPEELIDLVYSETEGNPFFVEEVFRHLTESGKLLDESGEFAPGIQIADTEVPRGVRLIMSARIERVSKSCQKILTLGAVVGRIFEYDLLLKADPKLEDDDVLDAIEEAEASNLIEDISEQREARYRFVHEQIRQTLLSGLSFPRRQRMHLRVAQGLEQQPVGKIEKNAGAIAHHFYQAGAGADPEKTVHYLMLAADRANDALAFEDAVKYLDSAIDIVPELGNDTHARLLSRKAVSLQGSELVEESIACLHDAVEIADSIDLEDELILQRCKMLLDIWRGHEAVEDLEKLLTRAKTGSDRHKELEAQRWMGRAYYVMSLDRSGFTEKTRDSYNNTIALGRELGEMEIVGKTLVQTAQLLDYWPDYLGEVKKNLEEADRISREIDNEDISIDVATMRLGPQLYLEEYEFGEAVLEKLLTRRDPVRLNAHYFRMMWSSLAAGRLERCVEICSDGAALAYRIGTLPVQYPSIKAMALMELGRLDEAWQSIEEEIADEDHRFGAALQELGKFQFELNCGATEAAIARAPHVISEAKFLSRMWMLSWVSSSLAFAQVWTEDDTRIEVLNRLIQDTGMSPRTIGKSAIKLASGAANDVIFELKAIVNGPDQPMEVRNKSQAMLLLGLALVKQGDLKEALEVTSDGVELCEQHQLRQTLWQIKALQANILDSLGDEESAMNLSQSVRVLRQEIEATIDIPEYLSSFKKNDTLNTLKL